MTAFKKQILLGVILVILANILAFALHQGLFSNIAWVIYGLLWIVHPVHPAQMDAKKDAWPPDWPVQCASSSD